MSILQKKLPPTLPDSSPVANGIALTRDPLGFYSRLAREAGDFAHYILSDRLVYFVNDPRIVREILLVREADFAKWAFNDSFRVIFGTGLIGSHGETHRKMRKVAQPPLQPSVVPRYAKIIVDLTRQRQKAWQNGVIDFSREMNMLTIQIVTRALFSISFSEERTNEVREAVSTLLRLNTKLGGAPVDVAAFNEANEVINRICAQIADEGPSDPSDGNLLAVLLEAQRAGVMPPEQLREELRTILLAGHVTTSQTLSCMFWLLARNPHAREQIDREIESVTAGATPGIEHVPHLKFCERVVLETLRLYPPVWVFGREALHDVELEGVTIETGEELVIVPWLLHRNPEFFPEPDAFKPERWENDLRSRLPRGSYLPFSTGARSCLGEHFAMLETILVLASIAQQWKFADLPDSPDPGWSAQLLFWPRRGIRLQAERRAPNDHARST
ncbi:MAG: hypothetical protein QOG48_1445 [Verrucomicrobiota bacterium]|jgi:cytochrome P450